jgi:hypothetical protein
VLVATTKVEGKWVMKVERGWERELEGRRTTKVGELKDLLDSTKVEKTPSYTHLKKKEQTPHPKTTTPTTSTRKDIHVTDVKAKQGVTAKCCKFSRLPR